ncbi:MAG: hypothetical protein U0559_01120 [Anaerolineae bacterium]
MNIITPVPGATYLEGQAVPLLGRAFDQQDGVLTDTNSITSWVQRSRRRARRGLGNAILVQAHSLANGR